MALLISAEKAQVIVLSSVVPMATRSLARSAGDAVEVILLEVP